MKAVVRTGMTELSGAITNGIGWLFGRAFGKASNYLVIGGPIVLLVVLIGFPSLRRKSGHGEPLTSDTTKEQ